jgi:hypothetical protein
MMAKLLFMFQKKSKYTQSESLESMRMLCSLFGQYSRFLYSADSALSSSLFSDGSALHELCETIVANFDVYWTSSEIICATIGMGDRWSFYYCQFAGCNSFFFFLSWLNLTC